MATKEKQKRKVYTTPKGEATLCYLVTPSDKFNKDGVYSVRLALDEGQAEDIFNMLKPEYDAALAHGKEAFEKESPAVKKKNPFKENMFYDYELDKEGVETGRVLFNFKMTATGVSKATGKAWERKPALFDAQTKPIKRSDSLKIWGGSVVRVSFTVNPYYVATTGCGISLCLEAAQILKACGGERSATSYGFEAEEGTIESPSIEEGFIDNKPPTDEAGAEGEDDF